MGVSNGLWIFLRERELLGNLCTVRRFQREERLDEAMELLEISLAGVVGCNMMTLLKKGIRGQNLVRLVAKSQNVLGELVNDSGQSQEAVAIFSRSRRLFAVLYKLTDDLDDGLAVLFTIYNTAVAYEFLREFKKAEELLRQYLVVFRRLIKTKGRFWPPDKINDREADCLNGLAVVLLGQKRFAPAKKHALEALGIRLVLSPKRWVLGKRIMSHQVLAQIAIENGNLREGENYLKMASEIRILMKRLWQSEPFLSEFYWLKANILKKRDRTKEALCYAKRALKVAQDQEDRERASKLVDELVL